MRAHRPRSTALRRPAAAETVRASDLVLAVTGIAMLGAFCLVVAGNLIAF